MEGGIDMKYLKVSALCLVVILAVSLTLVLNPRVDIDSGTVQIYIGPSTALATASLDYTVDGTADDVQLQAALNALPTDGGCIYLLNYDYQSTAATTVTRAINNVVIVGVGNGTYLSCDGATPIFTVGGTGWVFRDLRTDAGGISGSCTKQNVTEGTTCTSLSIVSGSIDTDIFPIDGARVDLNFTKLTGAGQDCALRVSTDRDLDSSGIWLSLLGTSQNSAAWAFGGTGAAEISLVFSDVLDKGVDGGITMPSANARFTLSDNCMVARARSTGWGFGGEPNVAYAFTLYGGDMRTEEDLDVLGYVRFGANFRGKLYESGGEPYLESTSNSQLHIINKHTAGTMYIDSQRVAASSGIGLDFRTYNGSNVITDRLTITSGSTLGAVNLSQNTFLTGYEMASPGSPTANGWFLWAKDNGAGKTQLMVTFPTGAAQQVAIQP